MSYRYKDLSSEEVKELSNWAGSDYPEGHKIADQDVERLANTMAGARLILGMRVSKLAEPLAARMCELVRSIKP